MAGFYLLTLQSIRIETSDTVTLQFPQPKFGRIHYKPGQYLTFKIQINEQNYFRSYSLCSAPRLDDYLSVAVKRVPNGIVSNYLIDHLKPGMQLEVMQPRGRFFIENAIKNQRHLVLFGGGSGITPLMSMVRSTLFIEPNSYVSLLYANRNKAGIIFDQQLKELTETFPNRFSVFHFLSRESSPLSSPYYASRIETQKIQTLLDRLPEKKLARSFYICGPEAMMDAVEAGLKLTGVEKDLIFRETFTADAPMQLAQEAFDGPTLPVEVTIGGEKHCFKVPAGASILEAALSQDIPLPYSCLRGICATCMGNLTDGQVDMAKQDTLLDFEIENGKVLLCKAFPQNDEVRIEL